MNFITFVVSNAANEVSNAANAVYNATKVIYEGIEIRWHFRRVEGGA